MIRIVPTTPALKAQPTCTHARPSVARTPQPLAPKRKHAKQKQAPSSRRGLLRVAARGLQSYFPLLPLPLDFEGAAVILDVDMSSPMYLVAN